MQNTALSDGDIILGFTTACAEHPRRKRPRLLAALWKEHSRCRGSWGSPHTQRRAPETSRPSFWGASSYKWRENASRFWTRAVQISESSAGKFCVSVQVSAVAAEHTAPWNHTHTESTTARSYLVLNWHKQMWAMEITPIKSSWQSQAFITKTPTA